jgi:hypothetical protein
LIWQVADYWVSYEANKRGKYSPILYLIIFPKMKMGECKYWSNEPIAFATKSFLLY